jgi:hypothetical protein
VRAYSVLIGTELGLTGRDLEMLNWAALLHDIGKLDVSPEILTKPGRPSEEEWQALRQHPLLGESITAPLAAWLAEWQSAIGYHHERWDGKGYPRGLAGKAIPLPGRIVAVADVYDVITSARSYKEAGSGVDGRKEIARCAGSQFDPRVVRAFLNVSLGRMRLVMGPLSWLSHAPLLARVPLTPAVGALGGAAGIIATAAASGAIAQPLPAVPNVVAMPRLVAAVPHAPAGGHTPAHQPHAATVSLPATPSHRPSGTVAGSRSPLVASHRAGAGALPSSASPGRRAPRTTTSQTTSSSATSSSASRGSTPSGAGRSKGVPGVPTGGSGQRKPTSSSGTAPSPSGGGSTTSGSSGSTSTSTSSSSGGGAGGGSPSSGGSTAQSPLLLALTAQPVSGANVAAAAPFTVKVAVEDSSHKVVSGDASTRVTLALANNPGGGALSCSGGTAQTVSGGVAAFSCSLTAPGSGYTIAVSSDAGLGTLTTNAFNVVPGAPAKLVFTGEPSNAVSGSAIAPAVQVAVEDSSGNVVTGANSTSVTLALGADPGGGTLSGTLTQTTSSGVATFANLHVDAAASGYTLSASSSGLPSATSGSFAIAAPPPLAATLVTTNSSHPCSSGATCATGSIAPAAGTTLLILVQRGGSTSSTDAVTSITGPLSGAGQAASIEYAVSSGRNYLFAWTATATGGSGAITVNFKSATNANPTIVEVVQLVGNDTTTPVAQAATANGTSLLLGGASANLASPSASDGELVFVSFLANQAITTPNGFTKLDAVSMGTNGGQDLGLYYTSAPKASTTVGAPGLGLLTGWGSIALELSHA